MPIAGENTSPLGYIKNQPLDDSVTTFPISLETGTKRWVCTGIAVTDANIDISAGGVAIAVGTTSGGSQIVGETILSLLNSSDDVQLCIPWIDFGGDPPVFVAPPITSADTVYITVINPLSSATASFYIFGYYLP